MDKTINLLELKTKFNKLIENRFIEIMKDIKQVKQSDQYDCSTYWGIGIEIYLIEFPKSKELYCDLRIWTVFKNEYYMSDIDITFFISKMLHKYYSEYNMCDFTPYHPHFKVNVNDIYLVSSHILLF